MSKQLSHICSTNWVHTVNMKANDGDLILYNILANIISRGRNMIIHLTKIMVKINDNIIIICTLS